MTRKKVIAKPLVGIAHTMKSKTAFRNAFARYGGALALDQSFHSSVQFGLRGLLTIFRGYIKKGHRSERPGLPYGNIYLDYVDNAGFNAIATIYQGKELIGIFPGAILQITRFFQAFMSDPTVFPGIGNAKMEKFDPKTIDELRQPSLPLNRSPQYPNDPLRQTIAKRLTFLGCATLFYHEVGHLALCHLPFLRDTFGISMYEEFPAVALSKKETGIRRTLELGADVVALQNSLVTWTKMCSGKKFSELHSIDLVSMWGATMAMFFKIMDAIAKDQNIDTKLSTHPSPLNRLFHAIFIAGYEQKPIGLSLDRQRLKAGILEVARWWRRNKLPTTNDESRRERVREFSIYRNKHNRIYDRLVEYQIQRAQAINSG
jgi:hypothetical protein